MPIFYPFWGEKLDKATCAIQCFYFILRQIVEFDPRSIYGLSTMFTSPVPLPQEFFCMLQHGWAFRMFSKVCRRTNII
jgi:hypothetical protein